MNANKTFRFLFAFLRVPSRLIVCFLAATALAAGPRLAPDGYFRADTGELWCPLGGFHGNEIPLALVKVSPEEWRRVRPHVWSDQQTAGQGHIDLWDASDELMRQWFRILADNGVTAVRLFPRARIGADVLDLCGKLNPELRAVFHRAFAAAQPYHIRFLLQIIPEPWLTGYQNAGALEKYVLPRYSREEMAHLSAAQRRFLVGRKLVDPAGWFTDPDVIACQKQYLDQALAWLASEPQVFALELYNEQGWSREALKNLDYLFTFDWEAAEIRWTREMVRYIQQRLPDLPVTISHPGAGVTGFDPIQWSERSVVDFYSSHLYAGLCGESAALDFAAVTGATTAIIRAGIVNFPGEWGVLDSTAPEEIRRRAHRDALWLSLVAGAPGFFQWTYDFPEEYRRVREVFASLPKTFSPQRPQAAIDIGARYRAFQDSRRYTLFARGRDVPLFPFNRQRQSDENLQQIFAVYKRSLDLGVPVSFALEGGLPPEEFLRRGPRNLPRPIRAPPGWQLSYLEDRRSGVWLAYLRSTKTAAFGQHFLAAPVERPLRLEFDLPKGRYTASLFDLATGGRRTVRVKQRGKVDVAGRTTDEYVVIVKLSD